MPCRTDIPIATTGKQSGRPVTLLRLLPFAKNQRSFGKRRLRPVRITRLLAAFLNCALAKFFDLRRYLVRRFDIAEQ